MSAQVKTGSSKAAAQPPQPDRSVIPPAKSDSNRGFYRLPEQRDRHPGPPYQDSGSGYPEEQRRVRSA
ncbi:hypothetical protein GCM10027290_10800 [Micromonospora sonneratiae]